MKDFRRRFILTTLGEYLYENIEFLLDKESDEYNHISNDYGIQDITKVHSHILEFSKEAIETFRDKVDLFKDIRIVFVDNIGRGALGRFRSGTSSSTPIVLLSEKDIQDGSKKYNVPLRVAVETTIFHELGHAICELEYDVFDHKYLEYSDEEEWVENFAYDLSNYGYIPQDLENFIEKISERKG